MYVEGGKGGESKRGLGKLHLWKLAYLAPFPPSLPGLYLVVAVSACNIERGSTNIRSPFSLHVGRANKPRRYVYASFFVLKTRTISAQVEKSTSCSNSLTQSVRQLVAFCLLCRSVRPAAAALLLSHFLFNFLAAGRPDLDRPQPSKTTFAANWC